MKATLCLISTLAYLFTSLGRAARLTITTRLPIKACELSDFKTQAITTITFPATYNGSTASFSSISTPPLVSDENAVSIASSSILDVTGDPSILDPLAALDQSARRQVADIRLHVEKPVADYR